jgi:hypothetical protein
MAKMKRPEPNDPAEVVRHLNILIDDMTDMMGPALRVFAEFQKLRASRLREGLAQIEKGSGKDRAGYGAVKDALERSVGLSSQLTLEASRFENWPKPKKFEWLVHGRVLSPTGKPAEALSVRVFDRDRKHDHMLGGTKTDRNGDFAIRYHESDFAEIGETLPDLYVIKMVKQFTLHRMKFDSSLENQNIF